MSVDLNKFDISNLKTYSIITPTIGVIIMSNKQGAAGYEVGLFRPILFVVFKLIMLLHTMRNGCAWRNGAMDNLMCDLSQSFERQEICKTTVRQQIVN